MNRALQVLAAAACAAAMTVAAAGPAAAGNEVRVKVDPLNWDWSGTISGYQNFKNPDGSTEQFLVQAHGGPQQVFTADITWGWPNDWDFNLYDGTLTSGQQTRTPLNRTITVINPPGGSMRPAWMPIYTIDPDLIPVEFSFSKQTDPSTGQRFYELKFYVTQQAPPQEANQEIALTNLDTVQSEGVERCDHAHTMSPGDELRTSDSNDTVCVTLDNGSGPDAGPIIIDTAEGNDVVLISGNTTADVQINTGPGNDTVVADTNAEVHVTGGAGRDAVVNGGNVTMADVSTADAVVGKSPGS